MLQLELLGGGVLRRVLLVHGDEPIRLLHKGVGVHEHFGWLAEVSSIGCKSPRHQRSLLGWIEISGLVNLRLLMMKTTISGKHHQLMMIEVLFSRLAVVF